MVKLCVSIGASSLDQCLRMVQESRLADLVEFRIDKICDLDLAHLLSDRSKPVVITCPQREEGGFFEGSREERAKLLFRAAQLGAYAVDIDISCSDDLPDLPPSCKKIVSYHEWKNTSRDLVALEKELRPKADFVKIITNAVSLTDCARPLDLLEKASGPTLSFAMGEKGKVSRILSPLWGAPWTYACLEPGAETAPGQLSLGEMRAIYPPGAGSNTAIFGVVGNPLSQSLSPQLHSTGFRFCQFNAIYLPFEVEDFSEFSKVFLSSRFRGFSITHPFKEKAFELSESRDPHLESVRAANTWVRNDKGWQAFNTDGPAAIQSLQRALGGTVRNRLIMVVGAGGAARAIAAEAKKEKAEVVLVGRNSAKVEQAARLLKVKAVPWDSAASVPYDILIHATPVGMMPKVENCCVPEAWIRPGTTVMDIIYCPKKTRLLRLAEEKGAKTVDGMEMFLLQAMEQFRLFTLNPAPEKVFRALLDRALPA